MINGRVTSRAGMFLGMTLHSTRTHRSLPPHALLVMERALTVHGVVTMEITVIAAQSVTVRVEMLHVQAVTIRSVMPVVPVIVVSPSEAVAINQEHGFAADQRDWSAAEIGDPVNAIVTRNEGVPDPMAPSPSPAPRPGED